MDVLGKTRPRFWRRASATADSWTGPGGAWSEPHGADVEGARLGRFSLRGVAQSGFCESAHFKKSRGRVGLGKCVHHREVPMRTAGEQASAKGDRELPQLS